jgi:hypothetical protein
MSVSPRDTARWYPLIDHPVQTALVNDQKRFKVVPAGRRSGKTERAKRYVVKEAMKSPGSYFVAAPTRDQVKRIYWNDLKRLSFCSMFGADSHSESELQIRLPNGSSISLVGLDQPQRIEGVHWSGGIIDEVGSTKANAWPENISPALDTFDPSRPGYRPWCWLIGVPEGLNHYHDIAEYARTSNDPDWGLYTWFSSDILPPDVILAAKKRLSPRQYRQEYEASFEGVSGRIYEDFCDSNITTEVLMPHEEILWAHDFNFTPMSSAVCVRRGNILFVVDEIVLTSAISRQSAMEFVDRYSCHVNKSVILYGDPAGRAGEKHGHASDYTEMEQALRAAGWKVVRRVKPAAPAIKDRQNAVRAKIFSAAGETSLYVNANLAPYSYKGLNNAQVKPGSTFQEVEDDYQHITTAIGYLVDFEWPIFAKPKVSVTINPTLNFWNR